MDVLRQLAERGAISTDRHFVYASGRHGAAYINLDHALPDTTLMARLCRELAAPFQGQAEIVAAPAVGGIVLAVLTAQALTSDGGAAIPAVWADKTGGGGLAVERAGFADLLRGRAALVVEDLITTGGSVAAVCREVERHGARVVGVSAVCNRGGATAGELRVPRLHSLAEVELAAFPADACPLCAEEIPIVADVGHGGEFQALRPDYPGGFVPLISVGGECPGRGV
ncbi:phosphoribosyltransferase family protein [Planosporangium mesophilum]|uniref:Orotate phosphoribosyltransferase n=1 Tax=Planosporangium mesophilum TaxID=689768 RepID=A0A8J3TCT0_9ACTN|nr:phosphoribosyltransferase family protein [Planosporangium mesophilum]NJC85223.1 phosphoribosyltransferase [Planosporangium mesophilum]GII24368.1 orotate phosphoribosyltransferase [Planosporangium mesophilum]